jgi:two-component system sensor kinase FixL
MFESPVTLSGALVDKLLRIGSRRLIGWSAAGIVAIAWLDWAVVTESLGVLYLLPILVCAVALTEKQILVLALLCAALRSCFTSSMSHLDASLRFVFAVSAYSATGLFVAELLRNRRIMIQHMAERSRQHALREEVEEHLRVLAESSPAAIFTLDDQARFLSANQSARQMLGFVSQAEIVGAPAGRLLPVLADALSFGGWSGQFRTAAQCQGVRQDGEPFVAQIWFSTYETQGGRRLAAIAVDSSEEMREREEEALRQLLATNRILAGAISHEVRNISGAISLVCANLQRIPGCANSDDFRTLLSLVAGLKNVTSAVLQMNSTSVWPAVDLRDLITQLRIVIEPAWREIGGQIQWELPDSMSPASADSYGLLQALLNLAQNSYRAVLDRPEKKLAVSVSSTDREIRIELRDSGPGVRDPGKLFKPFQTGAENVGLGLYVSRAMIRSYGGDLRYEPTDSGSRFVVSLQCAKAGAQAA